MNLKSKRGAACRGPWLCAGAHARDISACFSGKARPDPCHGAPGTGFRSRCATGPWSVCGPPLFGSWADRTLDIRKTVQGGIMRTSVSSVRGCAAGCTRAARGRGVVSLSLYGRPRYVRVRASVEARNVHYPAGAAPWIESAAQMQTRIDRTPRILRFLTLRELWVSSGGGGENWNQNTWKCSESPQWNDEIVSLRSIILNCGQLLIASDRAGPGRVAGRGAVNPRHYIIFSVYQRTV